MGPLPKIVVLVTGSLLIISVALIVWLRSVPFRHPCDSVQTVLSRDSRGRSVVSVFKACTALGTSVQEWVDLVGPSGDHVHLLTFVPWGGEISYRGVPVKGPFEPSATWRTSSDLRVSIGTVEQLIDERGEVDGAHITYDIRTDLSKLGD